MAPAPAHVMSEPQWTWQYERVIPNDTRAARRILREILQQLRSQGWCGRDLFAVQLATEEALVNAVTHGNQCRPDKHLRIGCRLSPRRVQIEVADEGEGFDPDRIPDPTQSERLELPGGRGLMLMRAFMTKVSFNQRGNCVVMEKRKSTRG